MDPTAASAADDTRLLRAVARAFQNGHAIQTAEADTDIAAVQSSGQRQKTADRKAQSVRLRSAMRRARPLNSGRMSNGPRCAKAAGADSCAPCGQSTTPTIATASPTSGRRSSLGANAPRHRQSAQAQVPSGAGEGASNDSTRGGTCRQQWHDTAGATTAATAASSVFADPEETGGPRQNAGHASSSGIKIALIDRWTIPLSYERQVAVAI